MRVLLSTYGGGGDVELLVRLAVRLPELSAEAVVRQSKPTGFTVTSRGIS